MEKHCLPLVYAERPATGGDAAPPMLVLLHGSRSNERPMFDRVQDFDPRLVIVSPRGPLSVAPHRYSWLRAAMPTPGKFVYDAQEAREAFLTVLRFVRAAGNAYHADPRRTYFMGFSQGATLAGSIAMIEPQAVAGLILLGAPIPDRSVEMAADPDQVARIPCFMGHGIRDPIVPIGLMREHRERLRTLLPDLTYQEYPGGHAISDRCLHDVSSWLKERLDAGISTGSPRPPGST